MRPLAERIRGADNRITLGEAAVTVADRARPRPEMGLSREDDARELLGALGLDGASWKWDTARVARIILEQSRHGREISANDIRAYLPERAGAWIPKALTALRCAGLAVLTDRVARSTAPGARGSLVRCYVLTLDGERLAAELAPKPGEPGLELVTLGVAS